MKRGIKMAKEFKSFFKTVSGGEGDRCNYPTRLDTYGCGCQHDCSYCYAKSLLSFRKLWNNEAPAVADIDKVIKKVNRIPGGTVLRLGGMTDCFMPMEKVCRNTYKLIKELNKKKIHYLIVTKSDIVADDEYIQIMDKELAHIQISVTTTDDNIAKTYEKAALPSQRIAAIEKLYKAGLDVQFRLSPFIPQYIDFNVLNNVKCDKILIEFLRVNTWVKKWFDIDYSPYTLKEGGYNHLPLDVKKEYLKKITGFKEYSICEDVPEHYNYWKENYNFNINDCCNLRK
jgi:DNA repair photolyase